MHDIKNKRLLGACLYGGLHPTVVAANIAATSNVPKRRKRGNGDVWLVSAVLVVIAVVIAWP